MGVNMEQKVKNGTVQRLDFDGRARELARIMGGLEITPALLSTAEEMLRTAREG